MTNDGNNSNSYESYNDYLNSLKTSSNQTTETISAPANEDQAGQYQGDDFVSPDDNIFSSNGMSDGNSLANGGDNISESVEVKGNLLSEGGDFGASGFSNVSGSVTQRAGGILNAAKSGIGNLFRGTSGAILSGVRSLFKSTEKRSQRVADNLNLPVKAVMLALGLAGGGGAFALIALLFGRPNAALLSDEPNCDIKTMIDDYEAANGAWEDWTEKSAQGAGKAIYTVLADPDSFTFDTYEWSGSSWDKKKKTNQGFGFSDEVIAGMLANAYAESSIRSDCYEMDYLVPDLHRVDENGNRIHEVGDLTSTEPSGVYDADLILGRTHHANWDDYCERMFELYSASGTDINQSTYMWRSDDTGLGSVHGDTSRAHVTEGYYPGIGLWQWTGQRAYNLSRFADIQPDPDDGDQDQTNDTMYSIDCQLAFLYYENWGDFSQFSVKNIEKEKVYKNYFKSAAEIQKYREEKHEEGAVEGVDYIIDGMNLIIKFKQTTNNATGVLAWGRQSVYKYSGKIGDGDSYENDGDAYKKLSFPGNDMEYLGADEEMAIDLNQGLYSGQRKSKVDHDEDVWDTHDEETTNRWPKWILRKGDKIIGRGNQSEALSESVPDGFGSSSWHEGAIGYEDNYGYHHVNNNTDNRVKAVFHIYGEAAANEFMEGWNLELDTLPLSGESDTGYWAITSNSDLTGSKTIYKNKYQSMEHTHDGEETRESNVIRVGRNFNSEEVNKLKECYSVVKGKHRLSDETGRDSDNDVWVVTIGIDADLAKVRQLRTKFANPKSKYIVADLTISAGAESAVEAARQFSIAWEGISPTNQSLLRKHMVKAEPFYILMQTDGWKSNRAYAHSVLGMIDNNRTSSQLRDIWASYVDMGCDPVKEAPDGIAECAVSWAWPKGTDWYDWDNPSFKCCGSVYGFTKCTSLYAAVKDAVIGDDPHYSSCDRGVCTAVRASGADDDFPVGNSGGQLDYAKDATDKWEALGPVRSQSVLDKLQPGDLLLADGHVMVFVGPDIPLEKWPGGAGDLKTCKYAIVHSSHSSNIDNSRGPRCDDDCRWVMGDSKVWYAFRAVHIDDSSEKKALAEPIFSMGYNDAETGATGKSVYQPLYAH